jgi:hypothetical protein
VSKLPIKEALPDIVYEFVPSLIMYMGGCCCAAAGIGTVVMAVVVTITIAAIRAMTYILAIVIPNAHDHNTFKRTVRKFRIYLSKKLKMDVILFVGDELLLL